MSQPVSDVSNSSVKKRGSGVGVNSGVGVGWGVSVAGIAVWVAVGSGEGIDVGVDALAAGWQAVRKMRHTMRKSFFIALITECRIICRLEIVILPYKTIYKPDLFMRQAAKHELPGALVQAIRLNSFK